MQYFFILGKNPILSKAEIEAVFQISARLGRGQDYRFRITDFSGKILILDIEKDVDINWLNSRLGGTVKIGKILGQIKKFEEFEEQFFKLVKFGNGKVYFGFSLYSLAPEIHLIKYQKKLNAIAMDIKGILREEYKINSRYVVSREPELSSVIVAKNKLLKNGAEICFFIDQGKVLMGQTLAVQAFEEFGARDFTRPGRDQISGMLPPKLARIMVNLAQAKEMAVILDPFCGSGTILQEALVLGYGNLIGSDNRDKAVNDTKNNLDWLMTKYEVRRPKYEVLKLDVKDLGTKIKANTIDVIITEPYLGPALKGNESPSQIETIIKELENLYLTALQNFKNVLRNKGKVVIIFPVFKGQNTFKKLALSDKIDKLGFKVLNKQELLYFRPKQFVWREIMVMQKTG